MNWVSRDEHVRAEIEVTSAGVAIYEWTSRARGSTVPALRELRQRYKRVHVVGVGHEPSDASWTYWVHMHQKGLIDSLEDDEGKDVTPVGSFSGLLNH